MSVLLTCSEKRSRKSKIQIIINKLKSFESYFYLQGDSGGPIQLILDDNLCVHYLVGVTSIGKACGSKDTPGIYTNIFSFVDWIEKTVWSKY